MRKDSREPTELRPLHIIPDYVARVPGSALLEQGDTRVIATATCDTKVPYFMRDTGKGWIAAEYSMLPGSTGRRRLPRERQKAHNRHIEIQRFIDRALRNTISLKAIENMTVFIDTDVVQADGSTRCASLNAGMLVLAKLLKHLVYEQQIADLPQIEWIAAVSVGIRDDAILVDLTYEEDVKTDADISVVSSEKGQIVEVQAFAEEHPVDLDLYRQAVEIAVEKNREIIEILKRHL